MGHTHIRMAAANEDVLTGALRTAWKLRVEKNTKQVRKGTPDPAGELDRTSVATQASGRHEKQRGH
jgi:hypothetical protein